MRKGEEKNNPKRTLYSSCFEIPEAVVNPQRRALGKRNNVKRLPNRPTGYGISTV
ncbi:MAG: hypothetical protein LBJ00_04215 [Planctomycetaceae bacterium]|nr:hypothetical protein [Planctomycetaceae bacterium]